MADVSIENLIPVHPQCRCIALPVDVASKPEEVEPASEIDDVVERLHPRYRDLYRESKRKALDFFGSLSSKGLESFINCEVSWLTADGESVRRRILGYIEENMPVIHSDDRTDLLEYLLTSWQKSTRTPLASAMKEMAVVVEGVSPSPSCTYSRLQMAEA